MAKIWRIDIVHHNVWILSSERVHSLDARSPQIAAERKLPLQSQVQIRVTRKARGICRSNQLLLQIHDTVGIPTTIFKKVAESLPSGLRAKVAGTFVTDANSPLSEILLENVQLQGLKRHGQEDGWRQSGTNNFIIKGGDCKKCSLSLPRPTISARSCTWGGLPGDLSRPRPSL